MLHFPSKDTSAHRADPAEVSRLHQLLGHHVWAFSNCRVDAPPSRVQEIDWLFYNTLNGTFILSEWKRFPAPVSRMRDTGEEWALANGVTVSNPIEQVARQLDAVRRALRTSICRKHFPSANPLAINVYQSVYCPQVDEDTRQERLRYGKVHATLEELARTVERRAVTAPLLVDSDSARVDLAEALAELFRCSVGSAVRRKLAPPVSAEPDQPAPGVRIAAIHRELASLHLELASLLDAPAPAAGPPASVPAAPVPAGPAAATPSSDPASPTPRGSAAPQVASTGKAVTPAGKTPSATGHLKHHVVQHVPSAKAGSAHVRAAFLAALQDGQLKRSGVHIGQFGGLVGQQLKGGTKLASLAPGGLQKWCLAQAADAGVPAERDATDPSIVRMTTTDPRR